MSPEPAQFNALQSAQQSKLLDTIDQLRSCGLDNKLSLPQLVVCGDQSAGKSSVLEALTEIKFPRADTLCTRFATEIVLRRAETDCVNVKIIPDPERSQDTQDSLTAFHEDISGLADLMSNFERIIESAKTAMGIANTDTNTKELPPNFARDTLSIEIRGPSRPQLTIVDLPGIFQNEKVLGDKALVDDLIHHYISKPRTICLAVITAMNDADNQTILTRVKEVDSDGRRSLGIVTKPDTLSPGSGNEEAFIELASNLNAKYHFKLGWHVLKNRKFKERKASFQDRNRLESEFFRESRFSRLGPASLGIESLRVRLSDVLFNHVREELPSIRTDVEKLLSSAKHELETLGQNRATPEQCREYLMDVCEDMQQISKCAITASYDGQFFQTDEFLDFDPQALWAIRRLRSLVQKCNIDFAGQIRTRGHTLQIGPESDNKGEGHPTNEELRCILQKSDEPIHVPYNTAVAWVSKLCERNRGRELQGNYNPLIIGELFQKQNRRWADIATTHLDIVAALVSSFIRDLLQSVCAADVRDKLWTEYLDARLREREKAAEVMLKKILSGYRGLPINYDHDYTETIQKLRHDRNMRSLNLATAAATVSDTLADNQDCTLDMVPSQVVQRSHQDMDRFGCEEALDGMQAIYKVKQEVFIDVVVTLAVEELVTELDKIMSPKVFGRLEDEELVRLAGEPEHVRQGRAALQDQVRKLESGLRMYRGLGAA